MIPNIKNYVYKAYYKIGSNSPVYIGEFSLTDSNNSNFDLYGGLFETKVAPNTTANLQIYRKKVTYLNDINNVISQEVKVYDKPFIFKDYDTNEIISFIDKRVLPNSNSETPSETKNIFLEIYNRNTEEKMLSEYIIDKVKFNKTPNENQICDVYYKKNNEREYIKLYTDIIIDVNGNCNIKFGKLTDDTLYDVRIHNKNNDEIYNLQFHSNLSFSIHTNNQFDNDIVYEDQLIEVDINTKQKDLKYSGDVFMHIPLSGHQKAYHYITDEQLLPVSLSQSKYKPEFKNIKDKYNIQRIGYNIAKREHHIRTGNDYIRNKDAFYDQETYGDNGYNPSRWTLFNFYVGEGIENTEVDILNLNDTDMSYNANRIYVKYKRKDNPDDEHDQEGVPELYIFNKKINDFEQNVWYTIALITWRNNIDFVMLKSGKDYNSDSFKSYNNKFVVYDNRFCDLSDNSSKFTKIKFYPQIDFDYISDSQDIPGQDARVIVIADLYNDNDNHRGRIVERFKVTDLPTISHDSVFYKNISSEVTKCKFSLIWVEGNGHYSKKCRSISIYLFGDNSSKIHTFRDVSYNVDEYLSESFTIHETPNPYMFEYVGSADHTENIFGDLNNGMEILFDAEDNFKLGSSLNRDNGSNVYVSNLTMAEYFMSTDEDDEAHHLLGFHGYLFDKVFNANRIKLTLNDNIDNSYSVEIIEKDKIFIRAAHQKTLNYDLILHNDDLNATTLSKLYTVLKTKKDDNPDFDIDFYMNFDKAHVDFKTLFNVKHYSFNNSSNGVNANLVYLNRGTKSMILEVHGDTYNGQVPDIGHNDKFIQYGKPISNNKRNFGIKQKTNNVGAMIETNNYLPYGIFQVDATIPKALFGNTIFIWLSNLINDDIDQNIYFDIGTNMECTILDENPEISSTYKWDLSALNKSTICRYSGDINSVYYLKYEQSLHAINTAKNNRENNIASNKLSWSKIPNFDKKYGMYNFTVGNGFDKDFNINLVSKTNTLNYNHKSIRQQNPWLRDKNGELKILHFNDGKRHTYKIDWMVDIIRIFVDDEVVYEIKNFIPDNMLKFRIGAFFIGEGLNGILYGKSRETSNFEFANIHIHKIKYNHYQGISESRIKAIPQKNPYEGNRTIV